MGLEFILSPVLATNYRNHACASIKVIRNPSYCDYGTLLFASTGTLHWIFAFSMNRPDTTRPNPNRPMDGPDPCPCPTLNWSTRSTRWFLLRTLSDGCLGVPAFF